MAILAVLEGSEETRQKRAVRRHLNKKKDQRPDRQDESVQVDESVVVGSIPHMEHAVHDRHVHGQDHPDYHIHRVAHEVDSSSGHTLRRSHYFVVHKRAIQLGRPEEGETQMTTERTPVHHFVVGDVQHHMNPRITHVAQVN